MTLLDFPGRVACTIFLGGCDFACPYCHNFDLAKGYVPAALDSEELLSFLEKRKGLLDGVAITGGEPCLNKGLPDLIRQIRSLGYAVKLDTNGNHPTVLKALLDEGLLDYVAMDIKNSPAKYAVTAGLDQIDLTPVRQSIGLLMRGTTPYEFRTTVVGEFHDTEDFEEIGQMIAGASSYFLQCFTDRESVPYKNLHAPDKEDLQRYAAVMEKYVNSVMLRGID